MQRQNAYAIIRGSRDYPKINGIVRFRQTNKGVLVSAEIRGLPAGGGKCAEDIFGFHIHEGRKCERTQNDMFGEAMAHYNPDNCPHPSHSGDLPPLFGNKGYAIMSVLTDRFTVGKIIGRVVIIHDHPDDFTTQPSGNSGKKIACGVIVGR